MVAESIPVPRDMLPRSGTFYALRVRGDSMVDEGIRDVDLVLHCAGPFSHTAKAMADACLRTKTHYLDITGEVSVFEDAAARDQEARAAGIMLMPGAGFDVVPSDCVTPSLQ